MLALINVIAYLLLKKAEKHKVDLEGVTKYLLLKRCDNGGAKFYSKTYKRCIYLKFVTHDK